MRTQVVTQPSRFEPDEKTKTERGDNESACRVCLRVGSEDTSKYREFLGQSSTSEFIKHLVSFCPPLLYSEFWIYCIDVIAYFLN